MLALVAVVGVIVVVATRRTELVVDVPGTTTAYHERFLSRAASPHAMIPTLYPLPAPQDLASADTMAAGGETMIQAAEGMSQAAVTMMAAGVPELVDLGQHWAQDAQALRERAAWMVLSASADTMVHDPDNAHELNLQNLLGNGTSMAAEGQSMVGHGQEMAAQVDQLRRDGVLTDAMADELAADAKALVDAGEALVRDGEQMQEYAEKLLQSIGE
jgi:hypothetical protein